MDVVSIIIPIYNAEKYIKYAIESCLNQTYNNIEILLIDDGSKDKSKEICQEYVLKDSRIKYYFQKNQGVCCTELWPIEIEWRMDLFFRCG